MRRMSQGQGQGQGQSQGQAQGQGQGRHVRLTHDEISRIRVTPGASCLLFITDRCPVGCAHCSVDSRADSPRITDFTLFEAIVERLCADPDRTMVGISGGEPFVERRGLTFATRRIAAAGKDVVVYTSGIWAAAPDPPRWIHDVLDRCVCVYLSTDAYHEAGTGPERFVNAARAIGDHQLPIVVQVVDKDGGPDRARQLLALAFGDSWPRHAEVVPTPGLSHGRGAQLFQPGTRHPGRAFGACDSVISPVVRYDGRVSVCCNESVIMGAGPALLRKQCHSGDEVGTAVDDFQQHPFYRALADAGAGPLTLHPKFRDLADRGFSDICGLCWAMARRVRPDEDDPLLRSIPLLAKGTPA
ncbi:radical SAM protein [Streptomyces sp. NPDC091280]|uniref:radical SAM protein n=1 Tax=Streptomyces sp. NPDC091280 TaxID=3365984 RepID=UPI0038082860